MQPTGATQHQQAANLRQSNYRDTWFTCKDCGEQDLWTAKQQQLWYEEQGGEIEAIAIRCHACRSKEKLRRETARKIHREGITRK